MLSADVSIISHAAFGDLARAAWWRRPRHRRGVRSGDARPTVEHGLHERERGRLRGTASRSRPPSGRSSSINPAPNARSARPGRSKRDDAEPAPQANHDPRHGGLERDDGAQLPRDEAALDAAWSVPRRDVCRRGPPVSSQGTFPSPLPQPRPFPTARFSRAVSDLLEASRRALASLALASLRLLRSRLPLVSRPEVARGRVGRCARGLGCTRSTM